MGQRAIGNSGSENATFDAEQEPVGTVKKSLIVMPPKESGKKVGLVLLGGAMIIHTTYEPMLKKLTEVAASKGISLYTGSPWHIGTGTMPFEVKKHVRNVIKDMYAAGLPRDAPMFYGGHSQGSVFIQEFVKDEAWGNSRTIPHEAAGQILMGGFLARKSLTPEFDYPVPTLTLAGELDGLARVTRMAESAYHQRGRDDFPVVVLRGVNHMQFASGEPPMNVKKNDFGSRGGRSYSARSHCRSHFGLYRSSIGHVFGWG